MTMRRIGELHTELGECPVWDDRIGRLVLEDIDGRRIHRVDIDTGAVETRSLPARPGSFVLTDEPDRLVVAMEHELVSLEWSTGAVHAIAEVERPDPQVRLNDGRCDRAGRYWVGSMDLPPEAGRSKGSLHRIGFTGDELEIATVRTGIGINNGTAFSPDGRTMYWADTPTATVWAYDLDPDTGERHGERVFLDFADLPGLPDGACVDADGCYWVACVTGSAVLRATPAGDVDRVVEVPMLLPTMPAFVGAGLDRLVVTSIATDRADADPACPDGCLLELDVDVVGVPEPLLAR